MLDLTTRTMRLARPEELPIPTVADAIDGYLEGVSNGRSPATHATYASALRRFVEYLTAVGLPPDRTLTVTLPRHVLESFYSALVAHYGRETDTPRTLVAGVRSFIRWTFAREVGPAGTTYEAMRLRLSELAGPMPYRAPRIAAGLPRVMLAAGALPVPEETDALRALLRDRALLRTLWTTGARRAEVCSLDRADIRDGWADQALITGKGGRQRVIFFDEPTLELIRAYLAARDDDDAPLFLRHNRGPRRPAPDSGSYRLSPQSIWLIVARYARLAGVSISTHDFRHAKASTLLNRGADLSQVQDILGHASPETTKRIYAHYNVQKLRQAFDDYSAEPEELADPNPAA